MNNSFQSQLLQHFANKKSNAGFTLIELLVVIIIIGVLSAVALPNLLGQVGKARESEAKTTIGSLNRAQQTYFIEKGSFASASEISSETDISSTLGVAVGDTEFYSFEIAGDGVQLATNDSQATDNTRDYAGGISYDTQDQEFASVLCRATSVADEGSTKLSSSTTGISDAGSGTTDVGCDNSETEKVQ
jgi:prepilin-type N-terminal cleavage/methylation domain-containing protein